MTRSGCPDGEPRIRIAVGVAERTLRQVRHSNTIHARCEVEHRLDLVRARIKPTVFVAGQYGLIPRRPDVRWCQRRRNHAAIHCSGRRQ